MKARLNTYTSYSIGCAVVWALILVLTQRRTGPEARKTMQMSCAAWWSGWTSATIARVAYPPPKKLEARADRRLRIASLGLVALGFGSVARFLRAASNQG